MTSLAPIQVRVDRLAQIGQATMSLIYVDGEPICWGLEDVFRENKIRKITRIPEGTYQLTRRFDGRHFRRYNEAYNHKSSLWVRDVPNFSWIMLHGGNTHQHTDGCLLTGRKGVFDPGSSFSTEASITAYRKLYSIISKTIDARGAVITYRDIDRWVPMSLISSNATTTSNCHLNCPATKLALRA